MPKLRIITGSVAAAVIAAVAGYVVSGNSITAAFKRFTAEESASPMMFKSMDHNQIECPQDIAISEGLRLKEVKDINYFVYEYTGEEPPFRGKFRFASSMIERTPNLARKNTLDKIVKGNVYYIRTDSDLVFDCSTGVFESTKEVPVIECPPPPPCPMPEIGPGCTVKPPAKDANGCEIGCPTVECAHPQPNPQPQPQPPGFLGSALLPDVCGEITQMKQSFASPCSPDRPILTEHWAADDPSCQPLGSCNRVQYFCCANHSRSGNLTCGGGKALIDLDKLDGEAQVKITGKAFKPTCFPIDKQFMAEKKSIFKRMFAWLTAAVFNKTNYSGTAGILCCAPSLLESADYRKAVPGCGNGKTEGGETCDDANTNDSDSCPNSCLTPMCGDGKVNASGETCDDGNKNDEDLCSNACISARCGDGIIQSIMGEECDDGNTADWDGCSSGCVKQTGQPAATQTVSLPPIAVQGQWKAQNPSMPPASMIDEGADSEIKTGTDWIWYEYGGRKLNYRANTQYISFSPLPSNASSVLGVSVKIRGDIFASESSRGKITVDIVNITGEELTRSAEITGLKIVNTGQMAPEETLVLPVMSARAKASDWTNAKVRFNFSGNNLNGRLTIYAVDLNLSLDCGGECNSLGFVCGNGVLDPREECDNGAGNSDTESDSCRTDCRKARKGDGAIDAGEECDDGNIESGDGCDYFGRKEICGDKRLLPPEECDDGNISDMDGCSSQCLKEICSNKRIDPGEECDDGNKNNGDGCSGQCLTESCGNGRTDAGEECDDGDNEDSDACKNDCTWGTASCGDGYKSPEEECDDGNTISGDGCDSQCKKECGNGIKEGVEECDDGDDDNANGCSNTCSISYGDGASVQGQVKYWNMNQNNNDYENKGRTMVSTGDTDESGDPFFDRADTAPTLYLNTTSLDFEQYYINNPAFKKLRMPITQSYIHPGNKPFTVSAWFKPNRTNAGVIIQITRNNEKEPGDFVVKNLNSSIAFYNWRNRSRSTERYMTPDNSITLNAWNHVAAVWDGTGNSVYINGIKQPMTSSQSEWINSEASIGREGYTNFIFHGKIDEVRMYHLALTEAEIQKLARGEALTRFKTTDLEAKQYLLPSVNQNVKFGDIVTYEVGVKNLGDAADNVILKHSPGGYPGLPMALVLLDRSDNRCEYSNQDKKGDPPVVCKVQRMEKGQEEKFEISYLVVKPIECRQNVASAVLVSSDERDLNTINDSTYDYNQSRAECEYVLVAPMNECREGWMQVSRNQWELCNE